MLTPQQVAEARKQLGINVDNPIKPVASTLMDKINARNQTFGEDIKQDFTQIGEDIISGSEKRAENIQKIKTLRESGTKGNIPAIFEVAGQFAGSASDAIAAVTKGAVKMALGPKSEQKVKELVGQFGQEVLARPEIHKVISWYDKLPDDKKDAIDAVGGFASLAGDFIGVGATQKVGRGAVKVAKEGVEATVDAAGDVIKATGKVAGEVIPSTDRIVNYQVTRALDFTQGDVKNIAKSTGNEVGEFLADKNLIAGNKDETLKMVSDFYETNYQKVRDEIGKVTKQYSPFNVPRYTEALKSIKKQVDNVPGLEKASVEVENLLNKGEKQISLNDVQRVKELLDEHFSLYRVTGEVAESRAKEGLANMRSDIKEFLEKEVKDTTNADIASLNNDVSTSRSIMDAIETRATKGLTTSNIKIGDLGVFGVGSALGSPLLGAAAVIGKKIIESSAIRLKIAKWLDGISDARKLKIQEALSKGEVPTEISKIVDSEQGLKVKGTIPEIVPSKTTLDNIKSYIFYNKSEKLTPKTIQELEKLGAKPNNPITLYRNNKWNKSKASSWSKKPLKDTIETITFNPEDIIIDTTNSKFTNLFKDIDKESILKFNNLENEVIIKPIK